MSWAKFDDQFHDDPDVDKICDSAIALHLTGTTWCARNETDGYIPRERIKKLSGGTSPKAIRDLLAVGWWVEKGDNYWIRSFLKYNRSHEELEIERSKTLVRVRKCRNGSHGNTGRNGVTQSDTNSATHSVSNGSVTPLTGASRSRIPNPDVVSGETTQKECADASVCVRPKDPNEEWQTFFSLFPVKNDEGSVMQWFLLQKPDPYRLPKMVAQLSRYQNLSDKEKSRLCSIMTYLYERRWENEDPFPKLTAWRVDQESRGATQPTEHKVELRPAPTPGMMRQISNAELANL